jgi:ATP/maltotriose-dependent transcriptional regulator MalT
MKKRSIRTPSREPTGATVAAWLAMRDADAERAAAELLRLAAEEAEALPKELRPYAEDCVGEVVLALLGDAGAVLRRLDGARGLRGFVRAWLANSAKNHGRSERREHARRARAGELRRDAGKATVSDDPSQTAPFTALFARIVAAARIARARGDLPLWRLTRRQWQVLRAAERGLGRDRAAAELGLDPTTVRDHARALLAKLEGRPRGGAATRDRGARRGGDDVRGRDVGAAARRDQFSSS